MEIVLIGTGNVAWHLANAFKNTNHKIVQVYGRNATNAAEIAGICGSSFTCSEWEIIGTASVYILAVSDSAIETVASMQILQNKTLIHVAGSLPAHVLSNYTPNAGTLYPLQSFTRGRVLNYSQIPFFIEALNNHTLNLIKTLATSISETVIEMNANDRQTLHLAAVFASNYVNHFFTIAGELMTEKNLNFEVLKPLINETVAKAMSMPPQKAQTGPACRQNTNIIQLHQQMLQQHPQWQKIYTFVANSIMEMYKK